MDIKSKEMRVFARQVATKIEDTEMEKVAGGVMGPGCFLATGILADGSLTFCSSPSFSIDFC
ncbi:MAG: hypothetical protein JKY60_17050 [Kordiimonadaceae bacterium]|nr:hypothetical protein [Kordiimonadaceae bacterium]